MKQRVLFGAYRANNSACGLLMRMSRYFVWSSDSQEISVEMRNESVTNVIRQNKMRCHKNYTKQEKKNNGAKTKKISS